MAKKSKKSNRRQPSITVVEKDVKVSKQAVGGVTGAVLGGMVAGPVGAIAGGFVGTVVGEQSARGRKPVKKTVDAIRSEVRDVKPMEKLRSLASSTKTLIASKKKKTTKRPAKKKSKTTSAKKSVKKSKAKGAKTKKRAKKKR